MHRLAISIWALGCAAACATPGALPTRTVFTGGRAPVTVASGGADAAVLRMIDTALALSSRELERWGGIPHPVTVEVLPSQRALQEAIGREGHGWLSAWARFDTVYLQSPRSWSLLPPRQSDVDRVILHELTHVLLYQRSADAGTWGQRGIPVWFDEGMASHTAQQAYRWPGLEDLARWYEQHPDRDPLLPTHALYRDQNDLVYGAGHHAFSFLVRRYGDHAIVELMARLKEGHPFDAAFALAVGLERERFEQEFRRFVILRGFKYGRPAGALLP